MTKRGLTVMTAMLLGTLCATAAFAADISTKSLIIKDNADANKRKVKIKSGDAAVLYTDAVDPDTAGAIIHLYSASDDFCAVLPAGANWTNTGKSWKFKDKTTKNLAQIKDGSLKVGLKSGVSYSLIDNGTQGTVNAQVQFGTGTRFCLRCAGNKKDSAKSFAGGDCVGAACDPEPSACPPHTLTILKGALVPTLGRFNYNSTLGLPGANAACNGDFPGTHACSYAELQSAEAAGDLVGLKDTAMNPVASFWAIDSMAAPLMQCQDDVPMTGSFLNWEYGTAHTMSRGQRVALNNGLGTLGPLQTGVQCNFSGMSSVGCCQ